MKVCINIDWLEVFCNEGDIEHDAAYFANFYDVKERQYGTPQYSQMFTLYKDGFPYIEIRRNPYSLRAHGGIFIKGDCHLRLSNRTCYFENPINELRFFILKHKFIYKSITRIDICRDFQIFENGQAPESFLIEFMQGRYSKLNLCNIAAHGKDQWNGRFWNSLKWGSAKSPITTKLYNKSLEMREKGNKTYICQQWEAAGADPAKDVWRVEISVKSQIKGFVRTDTGELFENKLNSYETREKMHAAFIRFTYFYFNFREVKKTKNGKYIRKSRCPRVRTFKENDFNLYKPVKLTEKKDPTRTDRLLIKKLQEITTAENFTPQERNTAAAMLDVMFAHFNFEYKPRFIWRTAQESTRAHYKEMLKTIGSLFD